MITKAIENAQRKVEAHNFEIRKHLLEYDDVMNKQREVIYSQRRDVLESDDIHALMEEMQTEVLEGLFNTYVPPEAYVDDWDLAGLTDAMLRQYGVPMALTPKNIADLDRDAFLEHLHTRLNAHYAAKMQAISAEQRHALERWVMLQVIDKHWKDHLLAMDYLKEGIGLRGYGQKNPLNEYKREAYEMFVGMTERIKAEALEYLFKVELTRTEEELTVRPRRRDQYITEHRGTLSEAQEDTGGTAVKTVRRQGAKVGRNAPCPCGSGKKYKKCCGI